MRAHCHGRGVYSDGRDCSKFDAERESALGTLSTTPEAAHASDLGACGRERRGALGFHTY